MTTPLIIFSETQRRKWEKIYPCASLSFSGGGEGKSLRVGGAASEKAVVRAGDSRVFGGVQDEMKVGVDFVEKW